MADKTIGIFTTIQGHKSIAEAIEQTLSSEYQVVTFSETDVLFKIYSIFYKYFPFLFAGPFIAGSNLKALRLIRRVFFHRYVKAINKFDQENKIDMFINTFWMYESVLESLAKKTNRPLLNALADPRTFHPTSIGLPPAINMAFDESGITRCHKYYPQSLVEVIGWFVRPVFEAKYDQSKVREDLQLPTDQPIVLFVTGSDGMESVKSIIKCLQVTQPATIIVACGHNQQLFEKIRQLGVKLLAKSASLKVIPLPFTTEIDKYMQAADLIVGKAGPNMMFEAVATLTPFIATSHVAGQEDGNLDLIRDKKLGYVEENVTKAATLISEILANPKQLDDFQPSLQQMATTNQNSKARLLTLVKQKIIN